MTERDRVLDAFRNCITKQKCKDCPWTECETIGNGTIEIPRDLALAVMRELVAQEPRVLTLEELMAIGEIWEYDTPPYLWLDTNSSLRNTVGYWCAWSIIHDLLEGQNVTYTVENYGAGWRCWTSRPTDAQREATPWD